jgi:hypothetical protein
MFGWFRYHFQKKMSTVNSKKTSMPFDFLYVDLMAHRWPRVMTIWKCWLVLVDQIKDARANPAQRNLKVVATKLEGGSPAQTTPFHTGARWGGREAETMPHDFISPFDFWRRNARLDRPLIVERLELPIGWTAPQRTTLEIELPPPAPALPLW